MFETSRLAQWPKHNVLNVSFLWSLCQIKWNFTGIIPVCCLPKIAQMYVVYCIRRSRNKEKVVKKYNFHQIVCEAARTSVCHLLVYSIKIIAVLNQSSSIYIPGVKNVKMNYIGELGIIIHLKNANKQNHIVYSSNLFHRIVTCQKHYVISTKHKIRTNHGR